MFSMILVVIGLGANIGEPERNLESACEKLRYLGSSLRISQFYWTKPISPIEQPRFLNAVASFETILTPCELFRELQRIERELGKVAKGKDEPRPIDLDLLFYGKEAYVKEALSIPHRSWKERLFVLIPLADLFESVEVCGQTWNIRELIEGFPSNEVEEIYDETCAY